ncbi:MAG: outer membrane protein assembly factor BamD [Rhodospirillales bacterium]|jgi:outer membrane protein assembly factor BamD|nr:outer membrane protein assembly factor BamD [Rhodospirillales bacterium]
MTRRSSTPLALAFLVAGACSSDIDEPEYVERPVGEIYNEAMDSLGEGLYGEAAVKFDDVERQHPYSSWATKAQLMAAYSYYQVNAYDEAVIALDRFIELHPSNRDTPYAYYLKGLCYYEQISGIARDQRMTRQALAAFGELVNRYPNSRYALDAKIKLDLTSDHLAGKDMEIGRYYLRQGHNLAAINRFKAVVENYQTTTHVPEALHRLTEAYLSLGIVEEAQKTAAVLGHNFPGSEWYVDSYQLIEGKQIRPADEDPWYKVW